FVLLGSALLLDGKTRRSGVSISALSLLMALLALAAGLVYLYDTDNLYGLGHIMQLAAHTALAFIVLAAGLLCSLPEHGVVALLRRRDSGGALARRLLPVTLLLPVLIGWLKLEGVRAGLYEPDFGMVLVALVYIVIFGLSVIWVAHFLSRIDAERERMTANLVRNETQLRTLVGTIPDLIWLKDTQGVYLVCNPAFEHFFGVKADVIVGKTDYDFVAREQADFFRAKDRAVMAARGPLRNEEWLTLSDGQRILAETTKAPTFDPQGNLTGVLGIARDITRRHQSEETLRFAYAEAERLLEEANQAKLALISALEESKAASAALHQSEEKFRLLSAVLEQRVQERTAKLEAVNQELETFSYSVSHDLRAPLRAIAGFVELLRKHSYREIDDKGRHYMDVISESAIQMARLIDDILTFSRIGRVEMTKTLVSLDQVLTEVLHTLQPQIAERKIEWHIGPLPQVQGERTMLSLVLLNLLSNALKFTGTRETARIEVGQLDSAADAGETICYVRDNGVGFDMQYVSKLFGLFQRLHAQEQFEGTGVGLANVQRIIQRHGGRVWAESRVDEGATFYFALPNSGG
ncbi:MAG TPA: ATP-binding protein, partial [Gallionella sp.]|nr:ATP-binding protein [Gallionella sp.]